ncbi:MAG: phosphoribosylanthranilate isomerase [Candidatus Omnitrophica bacterium]|nr:phosphoribosylanthranilate isomerase [Candidatus Omnitrophota bacterium]
MKVKICGNTNIRDAKLALDYGADYLGLIFAESKRKISLETALAIRAELPAFENFVGVFCNQPKDEVESIANALKLTYLQFHGDETALYCQYFTDKGFKVIKTFHVRDAMSLKRIEEYYTEYFLLDTYHAQERGGTGVSFDWGLLEQGHLLHEKLFLAGGLNGGNIAQAIQKVRPYAVDVASGVESSPGQKSPELLENFIRLAKSVPHHAS